MPPRHNRPLADLAGARALNVAETCDVTGFGRAAILEAIVARKLRSRRYAGKRIILVSDLDKWLDSLPDDDTHNSEPPT